MSPPKRSAGVIWNLRAWSDNFATGPKNLGDNHANNRERFVEGTHVFKVTGADLRVLKNQPDFVGLVSECASHLHLWTERGAFRHAKILNTPEAWGAYERLETTYFAVKEGLLALGQKAAPKALGVAPVFKEYFSIARLIGFDRNQAAIAANAATAKRTGISPLEDMGADHLLAPQASSHMTATQIGAQLGGMSAQAVNKMLVERGFQTANANSDSRYEPTERGRPHAVWVDVARPNGTGSSHQLRWAATVIPALRPNLEAAE